MIFFSKSNLNKMIMLLCCIFGFIMPVFAQESNPDVPTDQNVSYVSGKVLQVVSEKGNKELEDSFHTEQITQITKVLVLSGKYKGKIIKIENQLTSSPVYDIKIKAGDRVILSVEETPKGVDFYIADQERVPVLLILAGIFLLLLMMIGGMQGLRSMVSILVTTALVFFVLVPAVLNNFPIIPNTFVIIFISAFITILPGSGINLKSLSALLSTALTIFITGLIFLLVIKFAPLNGLGSQEAIMLYENSPNLNYKALLTAGLLVASLGAVMHISMSIADRINEFKTVHNTLVTKELILEGLNAGKEMLSGIVNTFLLVCVGSAFSLILLASNAPLIKLLNLNPIASEIAFALIGSIGIVFCVPITALIAGCLIGKYTNKASRLDKNVEK